MKIKNQMMMMTMMNGKDGYRYKLFPKGGSWGLL